MHRFTTALALLVALAVIWKLTRWIRPWDALVLLHAGHDVIRGISPYPRSIHSPSVYDGHAFVYPYASAWIMGPLGALPTFAGQTVFLAISAVALVGAWWISRTRSTVVLLALLLSSTTVIALQIGSVEPLLLLGIVAAWRWRDKALLCGACIATVVVAKVFLLPLLAWLVLARRWRAAGVAVAVSAALLLAGWSLGPLGAPAYMHMLDALSRHESRQGWSFAGYMLRHGIAPATADHLAIAVAGLTIITAWIVHLQSGSDETLLVGCVAASLFASPVVWAHYFVLLFLAPLIARLPRLVTLMLGVATWLVVLPHKVVVVHLGTWLTGTERAVGMQVLVVVVFAVV
ncbi:MAG TPA: glycosyltransferase 87 family protein, partial [Acidimicrobiia bacterium]